MLKTKKDMLGLMKLARQIDGLTKSYVTVRGKREIRIFNQLKTP